MAGTSGSAGHRAGHLMPKNNSLGLYLRGLRERGHMTLHNRRSLHVDTKRAPDSCSRASFDKRDCNISLELRLASTQAEGRIGNSLNMRTFIHGVLEALINRINARVRWYIPRLRVDFEGRGKWRGKNSPVMQCMKI